MRIISGSAKGRRLTPLSGALAGKGRLRPTSDRVREAVFNIIGERSKAGLVLDLCAGTGALGLEALSRGGEAGVFVDSSRTAVELIKKNIALCGFSKRARVIRRDLGKGLFFLERLFSGDLFELVFIDPPYRQGLAVKLLGAAGRLSIISDSALVLVEESRDILLPDRVPGLFMADRREYGDTTIWIYRKTGR